MLVLKENGVNVVGMCVECSLSANGSGDKLAAIHMLRVPVFSLHICVCLVKGQVAITIAFFLD